MYRKILVALENSPADLALLPHITELATQFRARLFLLHVADGWAARNYDQLKLAESEEMKADRDYLDGIALELKLKKIEVSTLLAKGNPPDEILKAAIREECDLIAMTSHGHRWLADIFFGSTISAVRHKATVPLFLVRAPNP
ncbi:MAG: UspA domain protein [Verrucomicrobiales bacterium]|nr:UspA domain protein [Verrucomicrobiales bacterium]